MNGMAPSLLRVVSTTQSTSDAILHINHYPERFRVIEPLAGLVGMKEGTRSEVMAAVWKLVKFSGAQDKEDGTIIRPSGGLEKVISSPFRDS